MIPFSYIPLTFSGILQQGIQTLFNLFGQFISYLIDLPTGAWAYIAFVFSNHISVYGELILPLMVTIFGITFLIVYTIISMSRSIESGLNVGSLMEGGE